MPRQPEGRLVKRIRSFLDAQGAWVTKIQGDGDSYQEVGLPDLFVCYKGHFLGLEVKIPGGKPSVRQEYVLERIRRAGGIGATIESVEEVAEILGKLEKKR